MSSSFTMQQCLRWQAPPSRWYKCNVDIATSVDKSYFGIGILIRDDLGAWFQGKMKVCYDFNSIREAEVVDLREAICMCLDLSLQ